MGALEGRLFDIKKYFPYLYGQQCVDYDHLHELESLFTINGNDLYIELNQIKKRKSNSQQHGDTGNNLWDCSILLAKCFEYNTFLIGDKDKNKMSKLLNVSNKNVLEIGAGTCFVGVAAALCNAENIFVTDLDYCVQNMKTNVDKNKYLWNLHHQQKENKQIKNPLDNVSVFELDWSNPQKSLSKYNKLKKNSLDMIVGSDIIWVQELLPLLINAFEYLHENYLNKEHGIIVIAEQVRSSLVSGLFWNSLKKKGFVRTKIPKQLYHPQFVADKISISIVANAKNKHGL